MKQRNNTEFSSNNQDHLLHKTHVDRNRSKNLTGVLGIGSNHGSNHSSQNKVVDMTGNVAAAAAVAPARTKETKRGRRAKGRSSDDFPTAASIPSSISWQKNPRGDCKQQQATVNGDPPTTRMHPPSSAGSASASTSGQRLLQETSRMMRIRKRPGDVVPESVDYEYPAARLPQSEPASTGKALHTSRGQNLADDCSKGVATRKLPNEDATPTVPFVALRGGGNLVVGLRQTLRRLKLPLGKGAVEDGHGDGDDNAGHDVVAILSSHDSRRGSSSSSFSHWTVGKKGIKRVSTSSLLSTFSPPPVPGGRPSTATTEGTTSTTTLGGRHSQSYLDKFKSIVFQTNSGNNHGHNYHDHHPAKPHETAAPADDENKILTRGTKSMTDVSPTIGGVPCSSRRFFASANGTDSSDSHHPRSAEFMVYVEQVPLVDNAGHHGLYTGTVDARTQRPNGRGTMIYSEETLIYDGQWVDGDWCGFGKLIDTKYHHVYQGGFFDNHKHGLGVLQYADGRIYDGTFALGKLEGKGHLEYPDGTKYWGHWTEDGVEHGRGKKIFTDGRVYDGEFDQGLLHGHGRMTFPDGSWYLGEWMDGERNGLGMEVGADGSLVYEGTFCKGRPIAGSSCPCSSQKSEGDFLLYRSSIGPHGTLVGNIPKQVCMRQEKFQKWAQ